MDNGSRQLCILKSKTLLNKKLWPGQFVAGAFSARGPLPPRPSRTRAPAARCPPEPAAGDEARPRAAGEGVAEGDAGRRVAAAAGGERALKGIAVRTARL